MRQIWYELRHQPVIAAVTVIGTALAIFMIMAVVMLNQADVVSMAPETARDCYMYVTSVGGEIEDEEYPQSWRGSVGQNMAEDLAGGVAASVPRTIFGRLESPNVARKGQATFQVDRRPTDAQFFDVYDFTFLAGAPYTDADVKAQTAKAVITESVAREAFQTVDGAIGQTLYVSDVPHTVVGVVADVSPIARYAYAQVWSPLEPREATVKGLSYGVGPYTLAFKAANPSLHKAIAEAVSAKLDSVNAVRRAVNENYRIIGGAHSNEVDVVMGDNGEEPDMAKAARDRWALYALLLIVPAINLSTMTQSRLRRRISEIGVRRAFGATRWNIVWSILGENFVVTLVGGAIGVAFSFIFGAMLFDSIYSVSQWAQFKMPSLLNSDVLFDWTTFAYALLFCFLLNLVSTGVPAWRASRVAPTDAINSHAK